MGFKKFLTTRSLAEFETELRRCNGVLTLFPSKHETVVQGFGERLEKVIREVGPVSTVQGFAFQGFRLNISTLQCLADTIEDLKGLIYLKISYVTSLKDEVDLVCEMIRRSNSLEEIHLPFNSFDQNCISKILDVCETRDIEVPWKTISFGVRILSEENKMRVQTLIETPQTKSEESTISKHKSKRGRKGKKKMFTLRGSAVLKFDAEFFTGVVFKSETKIPKQTKARGHLSHLSIESKTGDIFFDDCYHAMKKTTNPLFKNDEI